MQERAVEVAPVTLVVAGRRVSGALTVPTRTAGPTPGLLFVHGLNSSMRSYVARADRVARSLGITCLSITLSGHGGAGPYPGSEGDPAVLTARDHVADVLAAIDLLADHPLVASDRIGLCGASYGAFLSALATRERPVARLLLRAPAAYGDDLLDLAVAERSGRVAERAPETLVTALAAYDGDALVVESGRDSVIPPAAIRTYLDALDRPHHVVVPEAGHALQDDVSREIFLTTIVGWFSALVAPTS